MAPSFTSIGCAVRSRLDRWRSLADYDLDGRIVLVTGATSGLGRAVAELLARAQATVILLGRDAVKTRRVRNELATATDNNSLHPVVADLTDLASVDNAATELLESFDHLDAVIHNAGALNVERQTTPDGLEATVALHVVAPFLLTSRLLDRLRAGGPGRVLTMSSGGMYTAPLCAADLEMSAGEYHGTDQYAKAKRGPGHTQRDVGQCGRPPRGRVPRRPPRVGRHSWCRVVAPPLPSRPPAAAPHSRRGRRHDRLAGGRRRPTARQHRRLLARPTAASDPSARQHPAQRHRRTTGCAVGVVRRAQRTRPVSSRGGPRAEYLNEDSSNVLAADERHTPPPSPSAPARRRHRQRDLGPRRRPRAHGSRTRRWPRPNAARSTASSTRCRIGEDTRVLEIGSGWGELAIRAAAWERRS